MPWVWHSLHQKPKVKRPPERMKSSSISSPPKSTLVPGAPRVGPVAESGPAVTSGGTFISLVHQSKYSALPQIRPGGPHISLQPRSQHGAWLPSATPADQGAGFAGAGCSGADP